MAQHVPSTSESAEPADPRRFRRAWWASISIIVLLITIGEIRRWSDPAEREQGLTVNLAGKEADWLPYVPLLIIAPFFGSVLLHWRSDWKPCRWLGGHDRLQKLAGSLLVGGVAFAASHAVGVRFTDEQGNPLPPAYHDEYSYLFQAETFLAGRTWSPSFPQRPEWFDQMHVLNEGRFASRYFPGAGLWMAPFLALGNPWLGQQLAHAIAAVLLFWIGCELKDTATGLVAGILLGLSPGLLLFSNLLLAHQPTLVGLLLFVWSFLRMKRTGSGVSALMAGVGLTYAMLCRPMTAAGVGLPFGIEFVWWLVRGRVKPSSRLYRALLLGMPIVIGLAMLFFYNRSITGNGLTTPYQLYTDLYTPRHVYGFQNVVRGEQRLGPKVIDHYDRWAKNLDTDLAVQNSRRRLAASLRWTLGIVPLVFALLLLVMSRGLRGNVLFLPAAIISLHLVHIPYWFEGIMGWHYVLESAPFWLLMVGLAVSETSVYARVTGNRTALRFVLGLLFIAVLSGTVSIPLSPGAAPAWYLWRARLDQGIVELQYPRRLYKNMRDMVDRLRGGAPAIVFVIPDRADRSMDYVVNSPSLDGEVLFARLPNEKQIDDSIREAEALFPDRVVILFDARSRTARRQ